MDGDGVVSWWFSALSQISLQDYTIAVFTVVVGAAAVSRPPHMLILCLVKDFYFS